MQSENFPKTSFQKNIHRPENSGSTSKYKKD